ncbi:MAG TPA: hypothetical protein VFF43_01805 [Caldimonas sp.]|jgi:hypothetical protein|nr:hypothetical protein [Caldimonas sp.]
MHSQLQLAVGAALLTIAFAAQAQKPVAYPAKGQSASQQSKDDGECLAWAKSNTGIDPAAPAAPPPPQQGGQRVKGAAVGAAVGAIGDNDVGNAAAKGAVVGGVAKRNQRRGAEQQAAAQSQQNLGTYYKAYGACMGGRGYTVN